MNLNSRAFLRAQREWETEPACDINPVESAMEEISSDFCELFDIAAANFQPTDRLIALYMTLGPKSSQESLAEFHAEFHKSMEAGIRSAAEDKVQDSLEYAP